MPDWKAYVDFVNNIVVDGLAKVVIASLNFVIEQTDPEILKRKDRVPMLEIELDLKASKVVFSPDTGSTEKKNGLRDIVDSWINNFYHIALLFKRVDTNGGTYIKELQNNMSIQSQIANINDILTVSNESCATFQNKYEDYSYLFDVDLTKTFLKFLEEVGDPATGEPIGSTSENLKAAIAGETHEYTDMYPGMAKAAKDEGFDEIADWFETLAKAERSHANRFQKALDSIS